MNDAKHRTGLAILLALVAGLAGAAEDGPVIASPAHEETVFNNEGRVAVQVTAPTAAAGYRVHLDGTPRDEVSPAPAFILEKVERGEHRLQVVLLDDKGGEIGRTPEIVFFMWQASALFPSRAPPAP